ncbi:MAG: TrmH family RNA methyltransferase [Chlamydiia bacterium]
MTANLKQLGKINFLSLHKGAKHRILAKLVRRLYLDPNDLDASAHYNRFRDYDALIPPLSLEIEELSHLYHHLMEGVKPDEVLTKTLPSIRRLDHTENNTPFLPYSIYLDHLRSGHNVGSIIRTTEAFRLGSIHLSPLCPTKEHKEVKKTALGAEEIVPIYENVSLENLPRPWIAFETSFEAKSYATFDFPSTGGTLIFGNEEFGISNELLLKADHLVEIPLCGIKNSLNVSNAFSIIASHLRLKFGV